MPRNKKMKEEDVQKSTDQGIDRDFPGFPHAPSDKKQITPVTAAEKKTAAVKKKATKKTYGR